MTHGLLFVKAGMISSLKTRSVQVKQNTSHSFVFLVLQRSTSCIIIRKLPAELALPTALPTAVKVCDNLRQLPSRPPAVHGTASHRSIDLFQAHITPDCSVQLHNSCTHAHTRIASPLNSI
jgi:hypothetical protein